MMRCKNIALYQGAPSYSRDTQRQYCNFTPQLIASVMLTSGDDYLVCFLPNPFVRIFILPDSKKNWLPETVIPRPVGEFYLADDCRFNPVATLHLGGGQPLVPAAPTNRREIREGISFNPDLFQVRKETSQKPFTKAGPDPTAEFKSLAFVKPDKQCAKIFPTAFRIGISAANEFLLFDAA
jgi:hypothetical protein